MVTQATSGGPAQTATIPAIIFGATILISPRVLMAVEDAVGVEPVGDFVLKGISRPLCAFNVVGVK